MGIPYSREINAAFEQVTPLVAAGFQVLQTTKNIAILLACIQVLTVILLMLILITLLGLILTVNPDTEKARQELVTPAIIWLASWLLTYGRTMKWLLQVFIVISMAVSGVFLWLGSRSGSTVPKSDEDESEDTEVDEKTKQKNDKKAKKQEDKKSKQQDEKK